MSDIEKTVSEGIDAVTIQAIRLGKIQGLNQAKRLAEMWEAEGVVRGIEIAKQEIRDEMDSDE